MRWNNSIARAVGYLLKVRKKVIKLLIRLYFEEMITCVFFLLFYIYFHLIILYLVKVESQNFLLTHKTFFINLHNIFLSYPISSVVYIYYIYLHHLFEHFQSMCISFYLLYAFCLL